ncbi:hypothetical protein [Amantichitinum ursilacus]|uniref:Cell division protein ZapB n=1 Tax=Amantichitinum ursilacus TaxID=857265 RepID=A0A0N1JSQ0_9NEIS|nr:hypothetical protein [Amantichitinum ursilacus]KPC52167.1 hypothetical protein WG78_13945 [Amantichitinum ursilacus]
MDAELANLEEKIQQLAQLCGSLRGENRQLRQDVLALRQQNQVLLDKVDGAKLRVASLLATLPEDEA